MTRDFDLIRKILIHVEENHEGVSQPIEPFEGVDENKFLYHCDLLIDSNLLNGKVSRFSGGSGIFFCKDLTWKGQDYLASIKNNKVWEKVKESAFEKGLDLTLDIIAKLAAKYSQEMLGI